MTDRKPIILALLLISELYGCTVMQLKKEVESDEERVTVKEEELKTEEAHSAKLQEDVKALREDLLTRQMTLDDLQSRLAQLQRANANISAKTQEEQERKRQRDATLRKHQKEAVKIQQSGETVEEKRRKIEYLKGELRKSLNVLVHS